MPVDKGIFILHLPCPWDTFPRGHTCFGSSFGSYWISLLISAGRCGSFWVVGGTKKWELPVQSHRLLRL